MKYTVILTLIGIILENIINLYFNNTNIFNPLFTLINLLFIFNIFKDNKRKYLIICFIIGLIYDLFFTNFFVLNSFLFTLIGIIIYYFLKNKKLVYKSYLISTLLIIFLYNLLLFIILNYFNYTYYSLIDLSNIILSYIIINFLYVSIVFIINKKIIHNN